MDFETARRHMVDSQVRPHDVTDLRLQTAMEKTPRELFLPVELRDQAYVEREIEYAPGRMLLDRAGLFAKLAAAADPQTDRPCPQCPYAAAAIRPRSSPSLSKWWSRLESDENAGWQERRKTSPRSGPAMRL